MSFNLCAPLRCMLACTSMLAGQNRFDSCQRVHFCFLNAIHLLMTSEDVDKKQADFFIKFAFQQEILSRNIKARIMLERMLNNYFDMQYFAVEIIQHSVDTSGFLFVCSIIACFHCGKLCVSLTIRSRSLFSSFSIPFGSFTKDHFTECQNMVRRATFYSPQSGFDKQTLLDLT